MFNRKPTQPKPATPPGKQRLQPDVTLVEAYRHATKHRSELETSAQCGCFFCFGLFGFRDITKWIDADQTALCPRCGIDAVLGSSSGHVIKDAFLRRMHMQHFATSGSKIR